MPPVWDRLQQDAERQGAGLWLLLDPDEIRPGAAAEIARAAEEHGCDAILLGASTGAEAQYEQVAQDVHRAVDIPVLLFPNSARQVVPCADAILFMSLLSGRNPRYLIEEQVLGAPRVHRHRLETIATAYLLVEAGRASAVETVTGTTPIARSDTKTAWAHALAGRYLGMQLTYLEAGSGAPRHVTPEMVERCRDAGLPLAVGGGIRTPDAAARLVAAGARFVVTGNTFEPQPDWNLFREFVESVHVRSTVRI